MGVLWIHFLSIEICTMKDGDLGLVSITVLVSGTSSLLKSTNTLPFVQQQFPSTSPSTEQFFLLLNNIIIYVLRFTFHSCHSNWNYTIFQKENVYFTRKKSEKIIYVIILGSKEFLNDKFYNIYTSIPDVNSSFYLLAFSL